MSNNLTNLETFVRFGIIKKIQNDKSLYNFIIREPTVTAAYWEWDAEGGGDETLRVFKEIWREKI